ncbi:MAG: DUF6496 domain-containing protein [Candidatus Hydrogenedentes bacterium]|nr:DUF6496 domain-containing protein [Candidatus Hydrogenedentota bacterium]
MARYGKKAQEKVEKTMHEYKRGELKSGSGKKVTSRKQAVAIGLSEAREAGGKVPPKPKAKSAPTSRSAGESTAQSRATAKKSPKGRSAGKSSKRRSGSRSDANS